jgi:hypothetical protein
VSAWISPADVLLVLEFLLASIEPSLSRPATKILFFLFSIHFGHRPATTSPFTFFAALGYIGGYEYLQNRQDIIISNLHTIISALWRRYSWFESMRGSQIRFGSEARQSRSGSRLASIRFGDYSGECKQAVRAETETGKSQLEIKA